MMGIKKIRTWIKILLITYFFSIMVTLFLLEKGRFSAVIVSVDKFNVTSMPDNVSSCQRTKTIRTEVKFYKLSSNRSYHYEFRYELNKEQLLLNESRLIILLAGYTRACMDWWEWSIGKHILSPMRASGFSILAICSSRKGYDIYTPIQENMDVYWIYTTLQMWMNDVYYPLFHHYPRLYFFGVSRGAGFSLLLSRVLPVQAQILYLPVYYSPSLFVRSDYNDTILQNRLMTDYTFANWFYFSYCFHNDSMANKKCPLNHRNKNYLYPVPPIYIVHHRHDEKLDWSAHHDTISNLKKDAFYLGGRLLAHKDAIKIHVADPLSITPDYMRQYFDKWACKPWSSQFFYQLFTNPTYNAKNGRLATCWCSQKDFAYFQGHPSITKAWSNMEQYYLRDFLDDINEFRHDFCETVCSQIMTHHGMSSHHVESTLSWLNDIDHQRLLYKMEDFLNRPIRLWMSNKSEMVPHVT